MFFPFILSQKKQLLIPLIFPGSKTEKHHILVAYLVDGIKYWVAAQIDDLSAEQFPMVYEPCLQIGIFFARWKRHLNLNPDLAPGDYCRILLEEEQLWCVS